MAQVRGKCFDVKMPDGTKERYDDRDWHNQEYGTYPEKPESEPEENCD